MPQLCWKRRYETSSYAVDSHDISGRIYTRSNTSPHWKHFLTPKNAENEKLVHGNQSADHVSRKRQYSVRQYSHGSRQYGFLNKTRFILKKNQIHNTSWWNRNKYQRSIFYFKFCIRFDNFLLLLDRMIIICYCIIKWCNLVLR